MKITATDGRSLGFCVSGMRDFAKLHNLDWKRFIKEGLDANEFPENDAFVRKIKLAAQKREQRDE